MISVHTGVEQQLNLQARLFHSRAPCRAPDLVLCDELSRFLFEEGTSQTTFTGAPQRSGVPILLLATKGPFRVGRRRPVGAPTATAAAAR